MPLDPVQPTAHKSQNFEQPDEGTMLGFGFAWELGYLIAIPAVLFGLGGSALDKYLSTSPLFLLLGILFAFVISAISIVGRIRQILNRFPKVPKKKPVEPDPATIQAEDFHEQFRPPKV